MADLKICPRCGAVVDGYRDKFCPRCIDSEGNPEIALEDYSGSVDIDIFVQYAKFCKSGSISKQDGRRCYFCNRTAAECSEYMAGFVEQNYEAFANGRETKDLKARLDNTADAIAKKKCQIPAGAGFNSAECPAVTDEAVHKFIVSYYSNMDLESVQVADVTIPKAAVMKSAKGKMIVGYKPVVNPNLPGKNKVEQQPIYANYSYKISEVQEPAKLGLSVPVCWICSKKFGSF